MITYYNSFVLPYLSFNILHWGNTNEVHLIPLYTLQKRIIRIIAKVNFTEHTTPLFWKYGILKVSDLYGFWVVVDAHVKIQAGEYSMSHNVNTRNSQLALPKFHRLARTQQSVTFSGPSLWNSIPENIRNIKSLPNFKIKLKEYYLQQYNSVES